MSAPVTAPEAHEPSWDDELRAAEVAALRRLRKLAEAEDPKLALRACEAIVAVTGRARREQARAEAERRKAEPKRPAPEARGPRAEAGRPGTLLPRGAVVTDAPPG